ncbi:hypothetical protein P43SY_000319 [Pythium insidiosum]|uniref:Alcohol dehydrogenase-like N-terminal domain-containing protein n=1 Tax=Pythium insidiosum TaxID=114742 RepID=A0AAD5Q5Z2_PYTIN|nr:hypothetical protein P43SY_000319 [Pythium insidiosum]
MKAIQVTHYAPTDNIKFATDVPKPAVKPKSKDVLIRILACALNPADSHLMEGRISLVMNPKEFPYTVGLDVCGVVEEVGSACQAFKKGDRVLAVLQPLVHGGLADIVESNASYAGLLAHVQIRRHLFILGGVPRSSDWQLLPCPDNRLIHMARLM